MRRKIRPRGVPPALANHEILYADNVHSAQEALGAVLSPGYLTLEDPDAGGFAASLHGVRLRDVSLLHLDLSTAANLDIPVLGDYFTVVMPTSGRVECRHAGQEVEINTVKALITSPGLRSTMRFDAEAPVLIVRIEELAMTALLTRLLGRTLQDRITFDAEFDLTSDAAIRWNTALQLLHTEVYYPDSLIQRGLGIGAVEELLISSLLHVQPSNYDGDFKRDGEREERRVVRDAMNYLENHLGERITMDGIARGVHMSIRSIQQAFRDQLGMSPMTYLRKRRLERVREELLDALPTEGVTVTAVARRWGFNHPGSFAVQYREQWGESPSETLRR